MTSDDRTTWRPNLTLFIPLILASMSINFGVGVFVGRTDQAKEIAEMRAEIGAIKILLDLHRREDIHPGAMRRTEIERELMLLNEAVGRLAAEHRQTP